MLCWRRPEAKDRDRELIRKRFNVATNQVRSRVLFSYAYITSDFNVKPEPATISQALQAFFFYSAEEKKRTTMQHVDSNSHLQNTMTGELMLTDQTRQQLSCRRNRVIKWEVFEPSQHHWVSEKNSKWFLSTTVTAFPLILIWRVLWSVRRSRQRNQL